jgi:hypothetical protein
MYEVLKVDILRAAEVYLNCIQEITHSVFSVMEVSHETICGSWNKFDEQ